MNTSAILTNHILIKYILNNLRKLSDFIRKNNVICDIFDKKWIYSETCLYKYDWNGWLDSLKKAGKKILSSPEM